MRVARGQASEMVVRDVALYNPTFAADKGRFPSSREENGPCQLQKSDFSGEQPHDR